METCVLVKRCKLAFKRPVQKVLLFQHMLVRTEPMVRQIIVILHFMLSRTTRCDNEVAATGTKYCNCIFQLEQNLRYL